MSYTLIVILKSTSNNNCQKKAVFDNFTSQMDPPLKLIHLDLSPFYCYVINFIPVYYIHVQSSRANGFSECS